ncbi:MAG: hypothetical protein Q9211_007182, partial [Gyalolechia sp. 1 TL-2023]
MGRIPVGTERIKMRHARKANGDQREDPVRTKPSGRDDGFVIEDRQGAGRSFQRPDQQQGSAMTTICIGEFDRSLLEDLYCCFSPEDLALEPPDPLWLPTARYIERFEPIDVTPSPGAPAPGIASAPRGYA